MFASSIANSSGVTQIVTSVNPVIVYALTFGQLSSTAFTPKFQVSRETAPGTPLASVIAEKDNTRSSASLATINSTFSVAPTAKAQALLGIGAGGDQLRHWIAPARYPIRPDLGEDLLFVASGSFSGVNMSISFAESEERMPSRGRRRGRTTGYWNLCDHSNSSFEGVGPLSTQIQNDANYLQAVDWQDTNYRRENQLLSPNWENDFALNETSAIAMSSSLDAVVGISFTETSSLTLDGAASLIASLTFAETNGLSISGGLLYLLNVAFNETNGLVMSGARGQDGSLTLNETSGLSMSALRDLIGTLTFNETNGLTFSGLRDAIANISFAETNALIMGGGLSKDGNIALNETSALTLDGAVGRAASMSLAMIAGLSMSSTILFAASLLLQENNALTLSGALTAIASMTLAETNALVLNGALSRQGSIALNETSTLSMSSQVAFAAALALSSTMTLATAFEFIPHIAAFLLHRDIAVVPTLNASGFASTSTIKASNAVVIATLNTSGFKVVN